MASIKPSNRAFVVDGKKSAVFLNEKCNKASDVLKRIETRKLKKGTTRAK